MMAQDAVPFSGGTRECSSCGCYTPTGFLIRKGSGSYYLCPNCYHPDVYPLARCIVSISQKEWKPFLAAMAGCALQAATFWVDRRTAANFSSKNFYLLVVPDLCSTSMRRIWPFSLRRRKMG